MKKKLSYERKKSYYGYAFISIWLVGFIILFLFPFINAVRYSMSNLSIGQGTLTLEWTGLKNYTDLFTVNAEFLPAFTDTLTSVAISTPLILVLSLFIAVILNQKFKGRTFFRMIFFLPVIISSGIAIELINNNYFLDLISSGAREGALFGSESINEAMLAAGIPQTTVTWIEETVATVFGLVWNSGIQVLIFLAGLQSISPALYEVASVEGANGWVTFWKITVPMLAPMLVVNIFYTVVDNMISYSNEMFRLIDQYTNALKFDESAAMAILNFIVLLIVVVVVYAIGNRYVHYAVD